jgi:hypothetical protein
MYQYKINKYVRILLRNLSKLEPTGLGRYRNIMRMRSRRQYKINMYVHMLLRNLSKPTGLERSPNNRYRGCGSGVVVIQTSSSLPVTTISG